MTGDPYPSNNWAGSLVGLIFGLLLLSFLAQGLAESLLPLLPFILGIGGLVATGLWHKSRRDRW